MAARHDPQIDAAHRQRIQTSQLINRLQGHALGENEMTPTQIKAAEILIRKTLPDLQAVTLSGTGENGAICIITGVPRPSDANL